MSFGDRQRFDGATQLYRARFTVFPYATMESAFYETLRVLQRWVLWKERGKAGRGNRPIPLRLQAKKNPQGLVPEFVTGSLSEPDNYSGGMSSDRGEFLSVDAVMGEDEVPVYWALEYDESDAHVTGRRWNTSVGIMRKSGATDCTVNVRVVYYYLPSFITQACDSPNRSVPNFVKWLIENEKYSVCVGETVARNTPIVLTADNFVDTFQSDLLSDSRELPLVLQVANRYGGSYLLNDVDALAKKLSGVANVYLLDLRDNDIRPLYNNLFIKGSPSWNYGCSRGSLRVYLPHIDINDSHGSIAHRYFTQQQVDDKWPDQDSFIESLVGSFSGRQVTHEGDIVDIDDVDRERRRLRYQLLRKQADERIKSGEASIGELEELLSIADGDCNELTMRLKKANERANNAELKVNQLEAEIDSIEGTKHRIERERNEALDHYETERRKAEALSERARQIDSLTQMPSTLEEALDFVGRSYPDRVVVLEDARRSSRDYRCEKVRLFEQWELLMTIPVVLWNLVFGPEEHPANIEEAYSSQTKYVLTMREKSTTRDNPKMMKERERKYQGDTILCEPHIRPGERRGTFRVHLYFDMARNLIVIGHCGNHLTTAGTRRRR